jgi:hypothetical protein
MEFFPAHEQTNRRIKKMLAVKMRGLASKHVLMTAIVMTALAAAAPTIWTAPARTDNASVTGYQGDLVNRPGCWTENGYDREGPCDVARGAPGL